MNNHIYTLYTDLSPVPSVFGIDKLVVRNFEIKNVNRPPYYLFKHLTFGWNEIITFKLLLYTNIKNI